MTDTKKPGLFSRLIGGLSKSSKALGEGLVQVFTKRRIDAAILAELEEQLILADLGPAASARIVAAFGKTHLDRDVTPDEVRAALAGLLAHELRAHQKGLSLYPQSHKPHIVVFVGVNGAGKTTTIGKVAAQLRAQGARVMLAACDTFRAAAVEQLQIWGQRTGCTVVAGAAGADAAGVAFDAIEQAQRENYDVVLIDTAGRLHNKQGLMDELAKVMRAIAKRDPSAPHDILLVLDATVGRNGVQQAKGFAAAVPISGLIMTKLDGTARGGVLLPIAEETALPIAMIGVGEGVDDLQPFDAASFAKGLVGENI